MTGETSGGFGRTFGSIVALVVAIALGAGGYVGWGWYQQTNTTVQTAKQHVADRTRVHLDSVRTAQMVALVQANAVSARRAIEANTRAALAAETANSARAELALAQRTADSLTSAARTAVDSAAASAAGVIPIARADTLVSRQWRVDSSALAGKDSVIVAVSIERDTARAEGKTEAAIATTWQDKYTAEKKKTQPKWQNITVRVAESLGVALLTHLVFK